MVVLGKYIHYDGIDYRYNLCDRWFFSAAALVAHCRNTTRHAWCERCERVFRSDFEKEKHLSASTSHNVCWKCYRGRDFWSPMDLRRHKEQDHDWCADCDIYFSYQLQLRVHDIKVHNMCSDCGAYFKNENNLRMHGRSHQAKNLQCYGHCRMMFSSFSAMLIHLEAGSCPSGTNINDINYIAFNYDDFDREYSNRNHGRYPFHCPECSTRFTKLSGLFQHIETRPGCVDCLHYGGALADLEERIEWYL